MGSVLMDTVRVEYDTLHPDERISDFLAFCREVKSRYEGNITAQTDADAKMTDLEHYAELHRDLEEFDGYEVYARIRDTRRERRRYKSENKLLFPFYEWLDNNNAALNALASALGQVRKNQEQLDRSIYTMRTDIMEEWTYHGETEEDEEC